MKYILLALASILACVVTVFIFVGVFNGEQSPENNSLQNDTSTATSSPATSTLMSTTTASGETFVIDQSIPIEDRCTPVTKACLEAQPEWDPSRATKGVIAIAYSVLNIPNSEIKKNPLYHNGNSTGWFVEYRGVENVKVNKTISGGQAVWSLQDVKYEDFQQFAIYSESNLYEPVYVFQLEDGLSYLLADRFSGPGEAILFEWSEGEISVAVRARDEIRYYHLNPYTGQIRLVNL